MSDLELFHAALGLGKEWFVQETVFNQDKKRLDIYIDFERGTKFACPICGAARGAYDTNQHQWQHLNFFQYTTFLHAFVPRIDCKEHGIQQIKVPWARERSGFTLLFEAMVMKLVDAMPVKTIADMVGIEDTRLWRIIEYYVERDTAHADLSKVVRVGVDETSSQKGHKYVTLFVDLDTNKLIYVTEGKDSSTVERFKKHLREHKGDPENIKEFSSDLSKAFISGIQTYFPNAHITFDKFHVMKLLNTAIDDVRRTEQEIEKDLKSSKYIWLKNPNNLTEKQKKRLESLTQLNLKTVSAYKLKLAFQAIFRNEEVSFDREEALLRWIKWAMRSRLEPIKAFVRTLRSHWEGITRWFTSRVTNGILEGLNGLVQAAKARARGFRSTRYFKIIIYRVAAQYGALPT